MKDTITTYTGKTKPNLRRPARHRTSSNSLESSRILAVVTVLHVYMEINSTHKQLVETFSRSLRNEGMVITFFMKIMVRDIQVKTQHMDTHHWLWLLPRSFFCHFSARDLTYRPGHCFLESESVRDVQLCCEFGGNLLSCFLSRVSNKKI